jgi:4,5-DOPA dioxygenase extradiol
MEPTMGQKTPALFISHGAPTLPIDPSMPRERFAALGESLPRPTSILVLSAHWGTAEPVASVAQRPETIHDFYGFPRPLYEIEYAAPGAPELAKEAASRLREAGFAAQETPRGLDHGAWVPLLLMFPKAEIPVAQLSIQPKRGPAHHFAVGRALRALREEGVLVMGSGQITHNLREADFSARPEDADPRVREFTDWFEERLAARDTQALLDYRRLAPHAAFMHPTDEHLLPVFAALGAADDDHELRIEPLGTFQRSLAMTNYVFWPKPA